MMKKTPQNIAKILGSSHIYNSLHPLWNIPIEGVYIDSRELVKGQLFFALKGSVHDGHSFLHEVAANGAVACVINKNYQGSMPNLPIIKVDDTLLALQELAKSHVEQSRSKIISVTGSIGKTTTKDFIHTLLSAKYKVASSLKNQNSQVGLMLSLLNRVSGNEDYIVLEMSMTHEGNIKRLVEIAPPDIAVVTTIALVHAENFPDGLEGIARAKAEIFSSNKTYLGIINDDSPFSSILMAAGSCQKKKYSSYPQSTANWLMDVNTHTLLVTEEGTSIELPKNDFGAPHVFTNCLASIACARSCGMNWEEIKLAMPYLTLPKQRLETIRKQGITFIDDSYNASEPSMKAALSFVAAMKCPGKKVAIIGQMKELGKFSEECHKRVGEHAIDCVDHVVCFGEECAPVVDVWKQAGKKIDWFLSFDKLLMHLRVLLEQEDLVLLKGSRSNQLWRILDAFHQEVL
jgi:UDP-N-acetylmuramoyl-tripeptide--D-alanyl-D-alanine ligase